MLFSQKEEIDHVIGTIKVHVITLCQLNDLWERMLIVRRFQSKTTYFFSQETSVTDWICSRHVRFWVADFRLCSAMLGFFRR